MPLTDTACRNAKPREKQYKLSDSGGLYLLVKPDGARYWRMDYRFGGKRKTLAVGVYPDVSLKDARETRDAAKKKLADGRDPSTQKRLDRVQQAVANGNTFGVVADELLAKMKRENRAAATLAKNTWLLKDLAGPYLNTRPISQIEAPELLDVLRRIEAKGRYETARRLRSICGMVFRYAIATGRAERDVALDLKGALTTPQVKRRAAITDPKALGVLLNQIDGYDGYPATGAALRLAPLVFVRPYELRSAEWIEFDLPDALWQIPEEKMKMRRSHTVPLSRQAVAVLESIRKITGDGKYVFPSVRSYQRCMSENTLNAALRRLGYTKDQVCAHGFRRTASTILHGQGWDSAWIEKQLAHEDDNEIRAVYNAAEYLPERRRMMQSWADYLDGLKVGAQQQG